ncbi:MAG: DEAD/DEAH box helicase [Dehalococcoidia bacterium]|nr:DEAD/DEAH box helicase [Dehalococcoidia bacterium]
MTNIDLDLSPNNVTDRSSTIAVGQLKAQLAGIARSPDIDSDSNHLQDRGIVRLNVLNSARSAVIASLAESVTGPIIWITKSDREAEHLGSELRIWLSEDQILSFPSRNQIPYGRESTRVSPSAQRISTLRELNKTELPTVVVTSIQAVAERTLSQEKLLTGPGMLRVNQNLNQQEFLDDLVSAGYRRQPFVEAQGDFSLRGGIVDVFGVTESNPTRIEFFGDEVTSIREFSLGDQRSIAELKEIYVAPATEWLAAAHRLTWLSQFIRPDGALSDDIGLLRAGLLPTSAMYGPLVLESSLLDHAPSGTLLVTDSRDELAAQLVSIEDVARDRRSQLFARNEIEESMPLPYVPRQSLMDAIFNTPHRIEFDPWLSGSDRDQLQTTFRQVEKYNGNLEAVAKNVSRRIVRGDRVILFTSQAQRLSEELSKIGIDLEVQSRLPSELNKSECALIQGFGGSGWTKELSDGELALQTDNEILGVSIVPVTPGKQSRSRYTNLTDISAGDYVVSAEYGVARFVGIIKRNVDNVTRDYLEIRFAEDGKLFLPTDRPLRLSKYVGPTNRPPRLTRLGTNEWHRSRIKASHAVQAVAGEYLSLYAARALKTGHAFSSDTEWQWELESAFPYEETEDQIEAIAAVKRDMEAARPMDRLICGDVGFGKTEIAMRAAFKAVMDGFQVVILCPTTVLAQQHYNSFRERMAGFPIKIEMLSGFRTGADAAAVARKVSDGEIDIVIGTHRVLEYRESKTALKTGTGVALPASDQLPEITVSSERSGLDFKNLGLAIIDEEQRFGVGHKDRLKEMRFEVDVLTLSATPIPRTLHMALSGIRDMSRVESAPAGRQAIETYVLEWDEDVVKTSIERELARGGQVYVVHNRVKTIDEFAESLRRLVPQAKILVGHGQMPKWHLESVMRNFVDGEADVLVSTTIIESGLDIPNVNTILIDRAQSLGLSQLYQLRGRVGRSHLQAYAYLFHYGSMNDLQQQRLSAIFESSELGSGLMVAQRDLELRGAGNLLGSQQSGHIAAVGLDLYMEMLAEAVERLKHELDGGAMELQELRLRQEKLRRITVEVNWSGEIPEAYVDDLEARLGLYMRISMVSTLTSIVELEDEIADRYGPIPRELFELFSIVKLRILAGSAHLTAVQHHGNKILFVAEKGDPFQTRNLPPMLPRSTRVGHLQLEVEEIDLDNGSPEAVQAFVRELALSKGV